MAKQQKEHEIADDGCNYMTPEEAAKFGSKAGPVRFDPAKVKNHKLDVQYGTLPEQQLDVYLPEHGEKPYPVVFYVHGGGWTMGTKMEGVLDGIIGVTEHGYAVIAVDYRLASKTLKFPQFIFDVKTAVRWARAHAQEYGFDPDRFAMAGDSAGGHITLMLGYTAGRPEYAGEEYGWPGFSDELQAICSMYGPSTIAEPTTRFFRESGVPRIRREDPTARTHYDFVFGTDCLELLKLTSPLSFVSKGIPPTLLLHGVQDGVVPYQQSTILAERIREVCGDGKVEMILYEDRNHSDGGFNTKENSEIIAAFFNKVFR